VVKAPKSFPENFFRGHPNTAMHGALNAVEKIINYTI